MSPFFCEKHEYCHGDLQRNTLYETFRTQNRIKLGTAIEAELKCPSVDQLARCLFIQIVYVTVESMEIPYYPSVSFLGCQVTYRKMNSSSSCGM